MEYGKRLDDVLDEQGRVRYQLYTRVAYVIGLDTNVRQIFTLDSSTTGELQSRPWSK